MDEQPVMKVDLDGKCFDISQDLIDRYPESVFAKCVIAFDGTENCKPVEIDRDGKYFSIILDYINGNKEVINLSRMSHIEIRKLMNDANFFGIAEELVIECELELTIMDQQSIESADEKHLKQMLAGETRTVLVLKFEYIVYNITENLLGMLLKLVDRNRCLIVGCIGEIKLLDFHAEDCSNYAFLFDPVPNAILHSTHCPTTSILLQMIHTANTLHPYALRYVSRKLDSEGGDDKTLLQYPYVVCLEQKN